MLAGAYIHTHNGTNCCQAPSAYVSRLQPGHKLTGLFRGFHCHVLDDGRYGIVSTLYIIVCQLLYTINGEMCEQERCLAAKLQYKANILLEQTVGLFEQALL